MEKFQCPYCGAGCGLILDRGRIKGDRDHIATRGELCIKPLYYPEVLDKGRIPYPMYRENKLEEFKRIDWGTAYGILSERLKRLRSDQSYFYISGQLLLEDIYVINRFVKGLLKSNHLDSNSRLCMSSTAMAYRMSLGLDAPPCTYEDIDEGDTFIFIGSNAAWTHPVIFKRVLKRKKEHPETLIVTIDPIETATAKKSDIFLQINGGTDIALLNSVLHLLDQKGLIDDAFIRNCTEGYRETIEVAKRYTPGKASRICGIIEEDISLLARLFAEREKVISFWCQGLNQSSSGTAKNLALINLHLATGRFNAKGSPFSLTGQPNAMGGRLLGYFPHGLPGFRDVRDERDRDFVERLWGIESGGILKEPGPTIVPAVDSMLRGEIELLWVIGTNPAVSLPNLTKVHRAFKEVFLIVQDAYFNDTSGYANLLLPACQIGEKEGTMIGSDRTISLCQKFKEPYRESKPDWVIFTELAGFPYASSGEIFEEIRRITAGRVCDLSDLSYGSLPRRWGRRWLYEDLRFHTPSGRARFIPADFTPLSEENSFILITGRVKNQWHTMTRTGKSRALLKGEEEPFILIHPDDAVLLQLEQGDWIEICSEGREVKRKVIFGNIKRGHIYSPFGYPKEFLNPINQLVSDQIDPLSGQPSLKFSEIFYEREIFTGFAANGRVKMEIKDGLTS